jgi:hypothetical protein
MTVTVLPGFTLAASAANQPVPKMLELLLIELMIWWFAHAESRKGGGNTHDF